MADKIKVLPYTIRVQMQETTMYRKAATWYEEYAKENGVTPQIASAAIVRFAEISARVKNLNGVADFELADPSDTQEEFKAKFVLRRHGLSSPPRKATLTMANPFRRQHRWPSVTACRPR